MCETTYDDTVEFWKSKHKTDSYSLIKTNKPRHIEHTQYILKKFAQEIAQCNSICELGCGNGRNLNAFLQEHPHVSLWGNDINPKLFIHIAQLYPDAFNRADLTICDTLDYLKEIPQMDMVFTYGHLMHIPDDKIEEVCGLINSKALKYILLFEARDIKTTPAKQKLYNNYRWARYYSEAVFFPDFNLVNTEDIGGQTLYIFKRV